MKVRKRTQQTQINYNTNVNDKYLDFLLFDNGGETLDSYTLTVSRDTYEDYDMSYTLNQLPYHPLGIGQFIGEFLNYEEMVSRPDLFTHLGKLVLTKEDLAEVKKLLNNSINEVTYVNTKGEEVLVTSQMLQFIEERISKD